MLQKGREDRDRSNILWDCGWEFSNLQTQVMQTRSIMNTNLVK